MPLSASRAMVRVSPLNCLATICAPAATLSLWLSILADKSTINNR